MCNLEGHLAECSNSNVFFVSDGVLLTPSIDSGNLKGITRSKLFEICKEKDIPFAEKIMFPGDLNKADECFVTSATRAVMPVSALRLEAGRWIEFPQGGGALTRRLSGLYAEFMDEYVKSHAAEALF